MKGLGFDFSDIAPIIQSGITAAGQITSSILAPQAQTQALQNQINAAAVAQQQQALLAQSTSTFGIPSSFNIGGTLIPAWGVLGVGGLAAMLLIMKAGR